MKKYIVMLVVWACICYLASPGETQQEETQNTENVLATADSEAETMATEGTLAFDINFFNDK